MVIEEELSDEKKIYYCEYCYIGFSSYQQACECEKRCKNEQG